MQESRIEGLWDCVYCDTKGIKARFDTCPACNKGRGIDCIFYLPEDLSSATLSKEEASHTTNMPDWLCGYCDTYNKSDVNLCKKCGALKDSSTGDYGFFHKLTGNLFNKNSRGK